MGLIDGALVAASIQSGCSAQSHRARRGRVRRSRSRGRGVLRSGGRRRPAAPREPSWQSWMHLKPPARSTTSPRRCRLNAATARDNNKRKTSRSRVHSIAIWIGSSALGLPQSATDVRRRLFAALALLMPDAAVGPAHKSRRRAFVPGAPFCRRPAACRPSRPRAAPPGDRRQARLQTGTLRNRRGIRRSDNHPTGGWDGFGGGRGRPDPRQPDRAANTPTKWPPPEPARATILAFPAGTDPDRARRDRSRNRCAGLPAASSPSAAR